ncbi:hypothetical protein [Sphingomonas morindae]|uniref:Uncharacterized protein n=1 Tax=Sphingomonas morindae TaxID=1541170 RepID=A0ABY4XE06_9SPHN|nr:hypothetical protein [Sphingomonas morindae]USI74930.1 hypothetical protein LHA26_17310 [Sphingomonas morindae]
MTTITSAATLPGEAGFCRTQADREQREADMATLANVREKHQRAADRWTALADRAAGRAASRDARAAPATPVPQ